MQVHCRMPATSPLASALQSRTGFNPPTLTGHPELGLFLQRLSSRRFFFSASVSLRSARQVRPRMKLIAFRGHPHDERDQRRHHKAVGATVPHITVQRMLAPRTIEPVATGHCVNSIAIWSARARCASRGAIAVRDGIWVPQVRKAGP